MLGYLYIVLLVALALAALRRPAAAVAAALCLFGLKQLGQALYSPLAAMAGFRFTNFAVAAIILLALGTRVVRGECVICSLSWPYRLSLALLLYALVTLIWTPDPALAWQQWQTEYPYVITFAVLAPLLCRDSNDYATAGRTLIVFGTIICLSVLIFGTWGRRALLITDARLFEEETNPLALADLAGQVLITAVVLPLSRSRIVRWALTSAVVLICVAVMARSGSRGQLISALTTLAVAWPLAAARSRRAARFLGALVVIGVLGLIAYESLSIVGGEAGRWDVDRVSGDVGGRWAMATTLLGRALASPGTLIFGLGNSAAWALLHIYPHIVPLEILAEEGLIGFTLFCAMLVTVVVAAVRYLARQRDGSAALPAFAAAFGGFVFHLLVVCKQGSLIGDPAFLMSASLIGQLALRRVSQARAPQRVLAVGPQVPTLMR